MGPPPAGAPAVALWPGRAGVPAAAAPGVGVGTPAAESADAATAGTGGLLCFCQPSHSMTRENEKTRRRIRRRLSIGVSVRKELGRKGSEALLRVPDRSHHR